MERGEGRSTMGAGARLLEARLGLGRLARLPVGTLDDPWDHVLEPTEDRCPMNLYLRFAEVLAYIHCRLAEILAYIDCRLADILVNIHCRLAEVLAH
jgi:hypothetical protein